MPKVLALIVATFVAYVPEMLFKMSTVTDFVVSLIVGSIAYSVTLWYFNKLRNGM